MCHTKTSPEPVNQRALSECIAQRDLLPNQRQRLYKVLQENFSVFGSSIAYLTSPPSSCQTLYCRHESGNWKIHGNLKG